MTFNKVHCLFEQSGTFKKAFKELGYDAIDYDINKTENVDVVINLFIQINLASVKGESTIFDNISQDDLVIAFFPCTYFSDQSQLLSRGDNYGQKEWSEKKKIEYSIEQMFMRNKYYLHLCNLCLIAIKKGFKLIIENPYGKVNFLKQYFPIKPKVVIMNRQKMGDFYKKPTQFFFINCNPEFNLQNEYNLENKVAKRIEDNRGIKRSIISPTFAKNFIKDFII
jgi:hypothetical protein